MLIFWFVSITLSYLTTYSHNDPFAILKESVEYQNFLISKPNYVSFIKTYSGRIFLPPPKIILTIDSIINDIQYNGLLQMEFSITSATETNYILRIHDRKTHGTVPRLTYIRLNIIIFHPGYFPSILFADINYYFSGSTTFGFAEKYLPIDLTGTHVFCFFRRLYLSFVNGPRYQQKLSCQKSITSVNVINVNFYFTLNCCWDTSIYFLVVKDDYINVQAGIFLSDDWTINAVLAQVKPFDIQQVFILGLTSFSLLNPNKLHAKVKYYADRIQFQNAVHYNSVSFRYLCLSLKYPNLELSISWNQKPRFFNITYRNEFHHQNIQLTDIKIAPEFLSKYQIIRQNNQFIVVCEYQGWLRSNDYQIIVQWDNAKGTHWIATSKFDVVEQAPCLEDNLTFIKVNRIIEDNLLYFELLYLVVFGVSLISSKMIGIEMMISFQLGFFCLIQISETNYSMLSLTKMKYLNRFNIMFKELLQGDVEKAYSKLGFSSNFLSNVNLTVFIISLPLIISSVLFLLHHYNNHYQTKPILKKYAIVFGFQLPFALLLFNLFNIIVSFIIHIKSLRFESILSMVFGSFLMLLPVGFIILFIYFRRSLFEFNQQLSSKSCVPPFSLSASRMIKQMYPITLVAQIYLYSLLIGISTGIGYYGLYGCLGLSIVVLLYVAWIRPYAERSNYVRLLITKILDVLIITIMLISQIHASDDSICYQSPFLLLLPSGFLVVLTLILCLSLSIIILRLIRWVKKKTPIDQTLFKLQYTNKKPQVESSTTKKGVYMKQSMHSLSRQQKIIMKNQNKSKLEMLNISLDIRQLLEN